MMITKKITTGIYSNIAFLSNWQKKTAKIEPISNEYLGVSMLFLVFTNTFEVASQGAKSIDQSVLCALFILLTDFLQMTIFWQFLTIFVNFQRGGGGLK